jgi:hypothetical protein
MVLNRARRVCAPSLMITAGCPHDLPALILRCWLEPRQRPTFKGIVEELQVARRVSCAAWL